MTLEKAKSILESGDIEQATELLLTIIQADDSNVGAWLLLCGISTRTQNWPLGVKSFGQLVRLRSTDCLASSGLVQSYYKLGEYEKSLDEIDRFKNAADKSKENVQLVMEEHKKVADKINGIRQD
jgi:tetratricopeptide (TPR) repeat protein